jgi:hypothetical protein
MIRARKIAYAVSALAVLCFFLFPEPYTAVLGALVLQTVAYIAIAGRSPADGFLLTGISVLLVGLIPSPHPFIRGAASFEAARPWLIGFGAVLILAMLTLLLARGRTRR